MHSDFFCIECKASATADRNQQGTHGACSIEKHRQLGHAPVPKLRHLHSRHRPRQGFCVRFSERWIIGNKLLVCYLWAGVMSLFCRPRLWLTRCARRIVIQIYLTLWFRRTEGKASKKTTLLKVGIVTWQHFCLLCYAVAFG